mgnify:CR=1 FL=1
MANTKIAPTVFSETTTVSEGWTEGASYAPGEDEGTESQSTRGQTSVAREYLARLDALARTERTPGSARMARSMRCSQFPHVIPSTASLSVARASAMEPPAFDVIERDATPRL